MKKNLLSMFAMATMLLATGCSQEEEPIANNSNDYVDASFTVELSGAVQSRGLGEADLVDQLYYGIYQNGNVVPIIKNVDDASGNFYVVNVGEADVENRTATVKMRLVKGQTYDFVFWAQVKGNKHYNINMDDLQNITVNYNGDANDETRDAFFAKELGYKVESHFTKTIVLKRPFAQLNVGTTKADFAAAKILLGEQPITQSRLVVKKIPTSLNLLTGKVGEDDHTADAEFKMAFLPKADASTQNDYDILRADVNGDKSYSIDEEFAHLSMNYLLAAERGESELYEVDVEFANAKGSINTINVAQLPVYRNYRTNIIGNVLTTNGEFTIIIDQNFEKEEIIRELWDGESTEAVTPIQENGVDVYQIANAKQLAWVAEQVNSGANTFKDAIVRLTDHIYLNNQPWTPIGNSTYKFEGEFDGNGKTIYGLNIVAEKASRALMEGDKEPVGLFGQLAGSINDFSIDGANISHITGGGNGIGVAVGSISAGATVEKVNVSNAVLNGNRMIGGIAGRSYGKIIDCTVDNVKLTATPDNLTGEYDNGDKVGGIVGACWNSTLTGNKANNVTIQGYRDLGGIAGYAAKDDQLTTITGSTVTGLDIIINNTYNYKNYTTEDEHDAGAIVGELAEGATADESENSSNDVEVIYGGISVTLPVTNAEEFMAALNANVYEIGIAGEIDLTQVTLPTSGDLTLIGVNENAVLNALSATGYYDCKGANITFKNLTIKQKGGNYGSTGLANMGGKHTYDNCKFEGIATVWGECTYNDCEFTATVDGQYAAFAQSWYPVVYNNCKFTASNRAVKVCPIERGVENGGASEMGDVTVEYNNCTFIASTPNKPAVVITNGKDQSNHNENYVNVIIKNATIANMADKDEDYYGNQYFGIEGENVIVTLDDAVYAKVNGANGLSTALMKDAEMINAVLTGNIDLPITSLGSQTPGSGEYKLGGASTESINIDLNENKLNITTTYWSAIGAKNNDATFSIKNGTMTSSQASGTWNSYDLSFANCNYNIEDVVFDKAVAFTNAGKAVEMKNVTINETHDYYAMWITAEGQNVEIDGLTINSGGRGIKIDEQYVGTPAKVVLNLSNATFETQSKAAILVKSAAGADITLNNVDITKVAEDAEYAVWVDEDAAAYADLVRVVGGKKKIEGQIADGVSLSGKVYSISNANGMFWFANEVNNGGEGLESTFAGKTVKLVADIDLQNRDWEPIGQTNAGTAFNGTFDGGNYTIKNLNIDKTDKTDGHTSSGLFGWAESNVTIKNVKVNVANVKGHHNVAVIVGYTYSGKIENCHVTNAEIVCTHANDDACGDKCGLIAGYAGDESRFTNCSASNSTVKAGRDAGQLIGTGYNVSVSNCSATNVTVTATGDCTHKNAGKNINNAVIGRVM